MKTRINILANYLLQTSELSNPPEGTTEEIETSSNSVPDSSSNNEVSIRISIKSNTSAVDASKLMTLVQQITYYTYLEYLVIVYLKRVHHYIQKSND